MRAETGGAPWAAERVTKGAGAADAALPHPEAPRAAQKPAEVRYDLDSMSVRFEELEAVESRVTSWGPEPLADRAEKVPPVTVQLEEFLVSGQLKRLRQLLSRDRAALLPKFQQLVDSLRHQVDVGSQVEQLGGEAPWARHLAEVLDRFERQLQRRGFSLRPRPPSPWLVTRHPITGEFFVGNRTDPKPRGAGDPDLPLRGLIESARSDRLVRIPDIKLAARILDSAIENNRKLLSTEEAIARFSGQPNPRVEALASVLREAEDALEELTLVLDAELARVRMDEEPGEPIPYEQVQRDLGL